MTSPRLVKCPKARTVVESTSLVQENLIFGKPKPGTSRRDAGLVEPRGSGNRTDIRTYFTLTAIFFGLTSSALGITILSTPFS